MKKTNAFIIGLLFFTFLSTLPTDVLANSHDNIYVIQAGDTLPEIAKKFETSLDELKISNGLQSDLLVVGQKLWVPITYEVGAGDTLQEIASRFHSSPEQIKATNKLSTEQLVPGQILKIAPKRMNMQGEHILMTKEEFKEWLINQKIKRKVTLIQQHHTWVPDYSRFNGSNHFGLLTGMENFHRNTMGWKHIAQNITTFPDGMVAVSRPLYIAPEGTIGSKANSIGIAIEHIGNFDLGQDVMTKEQSDTIIYVNAILCLKFGLTPSIDSITYHHWWDLRNGERVLDKGPDYNVKTCPGTGFFGGNSTTSAEKYFYPLITRKMGELQKDLK
ncbi:LysM peptidoglycan-binding domain-containing protein [Bacillus timonensis]|uniref:LysM peptidoglycan-binding domain-containing protein n=1 Tax=Bacillus timonensis TaxID=1033734 RepID=UPI000287DA46|nr:LysM peptidoglycan-binding domain-containing protein [Bacillus timonensis]